MEDEWARSIYVVCTNNEHEEICLGYGIKLFKKLQLKLLTKVEDLNPSQFERVDDVKRFIAENHGIREYNQQLLHKGVVLETNDFIYDLFLKDNSMDVMSLSLVVIEGTFEIIISPGQSYGEEYMDFPLTITDSTTISKVKDNIKETINISPKSFTLKKDGVESIDEDGEKSVVDFVDSMYSLFFYFALIHVRIRFTKCTDKIEEFTETLSHGNPFKTLKVFTKEIRKKYHLKKSELKYIPSDCDVHLTDREVLDSRMLIDFWKSKICLLEFESNKNIDGKCSLM
eukprot:TCONS_00014793-protein